MILTKTPYRISLLGGGTDYPNWYMRHGGHVLSTAINKFCRISCRYLPPFFKHKFRIVYSKIETCQQVDEINHPAVREVLRHFYKGNQGLEIHHDGDLPARSGIGSSSSFTVGLINAIHELQGQTLTKKQLTEKSLFIEQKVLKEFVGSQDQIMAAHGGFNKIIFAAGGNFSIESVKISNKRQQLLQSHLLLVFTKSNRVSSEVAAHYVPHLDEKNKSLETIHNLSKQGTKLLEGSNDISEFGELLDQTWKTKKELSDNITNSKIDSLYDQAKSAGAIGGKLMGAGSGGFLLLFAKPENHEKIKKAFSEFPIISFQFEMKGTQVIELEDEK